MDTEHTMAEALEKPLRFNDSVASLQHLTCYKITQVLLNSYVARTATDKPLNSSTDYICSMVGWDYRKDCKKIVDDLTLPLSFRKKIHKCFDELWNEIQRWVSYMKYHIFSQKLEAHCVTRLNLKWLSWFQNGYVDYKQTAKNMISGPELNMVEKFIIMSKFCLVDDIKNLSLSMLPADFVEKAWPIDEFLICYWIRYLKNELHLIPLANPNDSIDYTMALKCNQYHWFGLEYFWNQLGIREKILISNNKLADYKQNMDQYYAELLSKMSYYDQRLLLPEIFVDVMYSFWIRLSQPQLALKTWIGVRDLCTVDQFNVLAQRLLPKLVKSENDMELFCEIWSTVPIRVRDDFVDQYATEFIKLFHGEKHPTSCFQLLRNFLSLKNQNSRKKVLRDLANDIIPLFGNCPLIIDAMKFCFPEHREQIEFKNFVFNSIDTWKHLIGILEQNFDKFTNVLKFYSPNAIVPQKRLEQIFMSNDVDRSRFLYQFNEWLKFSQFIDQIYSGSCSTKFKVQFYLSSLNDNNHLHVPEIWNHTYEIVDIAEQVISFAPEKAAELKQKWLDLFRIDFFGYLQFWDKFNGPKIHFVSWCLRNAQKEQRVDEFGKTILKSTNARINLIRLLNKGGFMTFANILKVYSPDAITTQQYLEQILKSNGITRLLFLYKFDEWLMFSQCIDQLFPSLSSMELKIQFVSSMLNCYSRCIPIIWHYTEGIAKIVDNVFLVSPEKASDLKQIWLDFFRARVLAEFKYWDHFDEEKFHGFILLCLGCAQDDVRVVEFKRTIWNSNLAQKHLICILTESRFEFFANILKVYLPDAIVTQQYLEQILMSNEIDRFGFLVRFNEWVELSQCIDKLLPSSSSTTFKIQFLLSTLSDGKILLVPRVWDYIEEIFKIVESMCVMVPEKTSNLKQTWFDFFRTNVLTDVQYWKSFDEQKFVKFVSWCLKCAQNDVRVDNFKKTICIDDVFQMLIGKNEDMDGFYRCLKWYFTDVDERKRYVRGLMHQLENAPAGQSPSLSHHSGLESLLRRISEDEIERNSEGQLENNVGCSNKRKHSMIDHDDE